ncbi:MAG: hypothetical protein JW953_12840 [Anaerolineae bacterium]|nr:hypothetical protein [Anaerolineae bacterium]
MDSGLPHQTSIEFNAARRRAFIEEALNFFTGRPNDLLSFEEVRQGLRLQDSSYQGLQEIELDKIVGSVGRYRDFTRTFLPKNDRSADRWRRVDAVTHDMVGTPPIEVYQVGDVYFVRDGNHRVSVARAHGAKTIEAYVIEYKTPVPIDHQDELDDILLKGERAQFLAETQLDKLQPGHNIEFTEPGRYRLVKKHITFHKYLKETECGREFTDEEAVTSWYHNVYLPVVQLIREREILKYFPGRTEADLYAWLVLHRATLEQEAKELGNVSDEVLVEELEKEAANPFKRLVSLFQPGLDLGNLSLIEEQTDFLAQTQLDQIRPEHNIYFTEAGYYHLVKDHIAVHKYLKETETSSKISDEEAVASWYDTVYLPVANLIQKRRLLDYFPNHTIADLYLWFVSRRAMLEEQKHGLGQVSDEQVIADLEQTAYITPMARLARFLRQKLWLSQLFSP